LAYLDSLEKKFVYLKNNSPFYETLFRTLDLEKAKYEWVINMSF